MSTRRKAVLWTAGSFLLLAIVGTLAVRAWISNYIRSDAFRQTIAGQIGRTLKANVELAPLHLSSATLSSDRLSARGTDDGWFSQLEVDQLRAELSYGRVLDGVWQVDRLEAEQANLDLSGPRSMDRSRSISTSAGEAGGSWWPHKVEVQAANLRRAQVRWDGGRVRDVALEGMRVGDEWKVRGQGGLFEHGTWPALEVRSFRLRHRGQSLFVENAELRQGAAGVAVLNGEVRFGDTLDLEAALDRMPLDPLLGPDWRLRLTGNLNGTIRVRSALPAVGPPQLSGSLKLTDGRLEALPILDELAVFTQLAQFRRLNLTRVEGDFRHTGPRLEVSRLIAESAGLTRIEGAFVVENEQIVGDFQVGLAPATLQWLPGVRTKLFATTRDGYCWAPMHMEGPVYSPREDLSGKLVAAVAEGGIDTVRKAAGETGQQLQDAAKKVLDIFLK